MERSKRFGIDQGVFVRLAGNEFPPSTPLTCVTVAVLDIAGRVHCP